jgi:CubicO group peptidase (beta-lactamase class C family)
MDEGIGAAVMASDHGVRSGLEMLSAWIEGQMAYAGLPGVSIAVVHDQAVVWTRGFGWADVERQVPATPETLYRIASITKLFTATAILQLRDGGRLRLDDPLTAHLPWFAVKTAHPDAPSITVRHLLTHTSGLPREAAFPYWTDGAFPSWDAVRARLGQQSQVLPTETRWKYSNLGLALAGEVVAAVSGQPWAEYVRRHILGPLEMTATFTTSPPRDDARLATGYARRLPGGERRRAPWSELDALSAAASMTTSVSDLARFAMLQFRDQPTAAAPVLRGSTLREMQRVHWLEPGWQAGWGLGFQVLRVGGKTYVRHGGALRGYRTELRLCPAERSGVIVFTNADDGDPATYAEKAFEWVGPAIARASAAAPEPRTADPGWQRYAGRYRNAWGDVHVLVVDGRVTLILPALPDPAETKVELVPVSEHTFRAETDNGYGIPGELVVFEMDDAGRVARVKLGENYADPVARW